MAAEALIARIKGTVDYYEILEVGRKATDKEIKVSYRKKALLLHPDRCDLPEATDAFQKLSNAHMCLSDVAKRRQYDLSGTDSATPNPFAGGGGGDPFAGGFPGFPGGFPGGAGFSSHGFTFHSAYPSNRARKRNTSNGTRRRQPGGGGGGAGGIDPDVLQYIFRAARMAQEAQTNGTHRQGTDYFAAAGFPQTEAPGQRASSMAADMPARLRNTPFVRFWTALIGNGIAGQVATYVMVVGCMMMGTALLMNHAMAFIYFVFMASALGRFGLLPAAVVLLFAGPETYLNPVVVMLMVFGFSSLALSSHRGLVGPVKMLAALGIVVLTIMGY